MLLKNDIIRRYGLSGNALKILALILMLIDHVGAVLLPQYRILRYIGRLSFPIYCFLITEGAIHTHNIYGYGIRLFAFALVSEIPFDLAIHGSLLEFSDQNVFFTLLIGLAVVWIAMSTDSYRGLLALMLGMGLAVLLKTDYSAYGVLMIYCFYIFRENPLWLLISIGVTNYILGIGGTGSQKYAVLAMLFVFLYSGKKSYKQGKEPEPAGGKSVGQTVLQYCFYTAYPIHLLILSALKYYTS